MRPQDQPNKRSARFRRNPPRKTWQIEGMGTSLSAQPSRPVNRALLVGYGKLGSRLAASLTADGTEVFALRRTTSELPAGVSGITADVSFPLTAELPAVDSMVVTLPPGERVDGYRRVLRHLADALPGIPSRTVFVSSTGVFAGAGAAHVLTENDEPALTTDRARALRDGELAAQEMFSAIVLRPAGIYGPGRDFLIRRVREHAGVDYQRWTNRIHETDLVRTLEELLRMPEPPSLLHALDEKSAPLGEVATFIADTLGVAPPPDLDAPGPTGHVLDGSLLRRVLGTLEYPTYVAGYREMIERA